MIITSNHFPTPLSTVSLRLSIRASIRGLNKWVQTLSQLSILSGFSRNSGFYYLLVPTNKSFSWGCREVEMRHLLHNTEMGQMSHRIIGPKL